MRVVISRFKVANGMEADVLRAFQERPGLVDDAPGFLGLEVFTDPGDPTVFYLVTRWTDQASFEAWHGSDAHRVSHKGIPRGLKLTPAYTEVRHLQRIPTDGTRDSDAAILSDALPLLVKFLRTGARLHLLTTDAAAQVAFCSSHLLERLGRPATEIIGQPLARLLTVDDAATVAEVLDSGRIPEGRRLVNFVNAAHVPFTLSCCLAVQPTGLTIIGEEPGRTDDAAAELLRVNNELATLGREHARRTRELARVNGELDQMLKDLRSSHWLLRKLQEVLPICMECGRVEAGAGWESVADYLRANSGFLSHGYCPECLPQVQARWEQEPG